MKQGVIVLVVLLLANLVAAGVVGQLSQIIREVAPWTRQEWWPWVIVGAIGIGCGLLFFRGAIETLVGTSRHKRKTT